MPRTVLIAATLDTKPEEALYLRDLIAARGLAPLVVDCGTVGEPPVQGDITREEVARHAGHDLAALVATRDKGRMIAAMTQGLCACVEHLHRDRRIDGIIAVGGGQGTAIGTAAMQRLPLGFPKVMVSTLAGKDMRRFVGTRDIAVFPCVADMLGMNYLLRATLGNAAHAIAGMVEAAQPVGRSPCPVIGATAFGVTTAGLMKLRRLLAGIPVEVAFFHANGVGGRSMEDLAREGHFQLLLDWTTHELLDQVAGGIFEPPADRMGILAERAIPCVASVGALDYVVKGPVDDLDASWRSRRIIVHNRNITLVRATAEEMVRAAELLASKLNRALGPVRVMVPLRGFSEPNAKGKPFFDPEADATFLRALKGALRPEVQVLELDAHINDDAFVRAAADQVSALLGVRRAPEVAP
jgi:uncharacterized protein (UPF0261 family)